MRKLALFMVAAFTLGASAAEQGNNPSGQYFRLFAPLTFYHNVAGSQFSIASKNPDEVSQAIDQALMHVYLTRPDLVQVTQSEQEKSGALRQDIIEESVVKQDIEMVEQAEPLPDMPEAEPVQVVVEKPNFWKYKCDTYLQFMQNYVSDNWYKGGENNYAAVGSITMEANYDNKSKFKWDNKLEMKLGFQTSPSDTVHRLKANEDLLRYTGKIGLQAANRWYYTLQLLAYTQFTRGFRANNENTFSDFMSPFKLNVGIGMEYKVEALNKRLTGNLNFLPLSFNFMYVGREALISRNGIKGDHHTLEDFGSQFTANLQWKITDQVTYKTRLYANTSYHRSLVEWENQFELKVSRYISANLFLYPRFDDSSVRDDDLGYFQFQEYSSLGVSYSF